MSRFHCGEGKIYFLSESNVEQIHSDVLMPGNLCGWLKKSDLLGALSRPQAHYDYGERDLVALAAVLWHGVSVAHGFQDANKRTGLQSALVFLEANGVEADVSVSSAEPGKFVKALFEQNKFEIPKLVHYLNTRSCWIVEE